MTTRVDSVGDFDLPVWLPAGGQGPAILLIQEIFGLDDYLRSVAGELAAAGFVVGVPDLFWRTDPGWSSAHDEAGLNASLAVSAEFDPELGLADVVASLAHLRSLPEVTGKAGALGFCLGGSLAYGLAATADPDAVVSFYGSTVPAQLDLLDRITCPLQFHFGGQDPYIPRDAVATVEAAVASRPNIEIHVQEQAGHAFHNHAAPMFHHPEAAATAWQLATTFLTTHLH
ncbi:dienelactone hydrolase family protein [Kutzneria sp. CA-103260]|uniref:dienelactone hydrolase family protein n=1 Tax=Kutzneria sp. CA-103260 TaxID=2802641 RepID=UPI001BEEF065|nr:dienelactone hydrolase family protein [Kutzneria sp. CA-103260]QUQ62792.1 carboxymethylenebutenolidase [Kutzneria sp. CA-103260]